MLLVTVDTIVVMVCMLANWYISYCVQGDPRHSPLYIVDCGATCLHGSCQGNMCVCNYGWTGSRCDEGKATVL